MPTFGVSATDGTIAECKARPENRGRGRCFHSDHVELEGALAAPATVRAYNEELLAAHFGSCPTPVQSSPTPAAMPRRIQTHPANRALTPKEFHEATIGISDAFSQDHWELLNGFYSNFNRLLREEHHLQHSAQQAAARIKDYLDSDSSAAVAVREFLGPEVNTETFAAILVNQVRGMTAAVSLRNSKKRDSIGRVMLTSVANDMTKRRYVASVLFFGGRCCYCNTVMEKTPGPNQATGEHLTPISPDNDSGPIGVTRYGNMALACWACNHERKNTDLHEWVASTDRLKGPEKQAALTRIEAFRRFALYEEYNDEESATLRNAVDEMKTAMEKRPKTDGRWSDADFDELNLGLKARMYDLRTSLQRA